MVPTIEWKDGIVRMLDQTRLPLEVTFFDCRTYHDVAKGIKDLIIRGAPAIGIAAAMGVALGAQEINTKNFKNFYDELEKVCNHIGSTRPTAVNLFWAINRMKEFTLSNKEKPIIEIKKALIDEANRILQEDIEACKTMGRHGAQFIKDGDTILTHCNAGALATGGYGTALGVIRAAKEEGKEIKVFADETRPVLQGARLTAWELMEDGIAVTLITDNMAGYFMKKGMINLCIVGADRIARNGDVANKIGTYSVAVLAREHGIPFYVAAPLSTIDFNIPSGEHIPIEERNPAEVSHIFGKTQIAPSKVRILNPAFDVTPARYIAAIITEKGCFKPEDIGRLK
ncbi:MAG: S-methyl-5-thioribose-1-phosphate isomerase [Nitrospirae bacterium RIFCSPHIGHO2_02_FULL_42_12]|nr:MAG: S-methyl-5-thioribose-1-phosphate isomerase [Nitrospirae bacterium RIFCSPHIGHO2_02_FULL_42_12]